MAPIADSMSSYNGSLENLAFHRAAVEKDYAKTGQKMPELDPKILKENHKQFEGMAKDLTQMNFKEWLEVTIATFRNQDPMNPQDPGKIAEQFATMGMAIGFSEARKDMGTMMDLMTKSMVLQANASTGKMVEVESPDFKLREGEKVQLTFDLPQPAAAIDVEIVDAKTGSHVATFAFDGDINVGRNKVTWDGSLTDHNKKVIPGQKATPGQYRFVVHAKDAEGKALRDHYTQDPLNIRRFTSGLLEASFMENKKPMLSVDGKTVPFDAWSRTESDRILGQAKQEETAPVPAPAAAAPVADTTPQPSEIENQMMHRLYKQVIGKYNLF